MKPIKFMEVCERPRERLLERGPKSLSDQELLAVILGAGSRRAGLHEISKRVLKAIDLINSPLPEDLTPIAGVGKAKASLLCAALEFSRRRIRPEGTKIADACDVFPLVKHYADRKQEHFITVSLNGAHEVIAVRVVTIGLLNSTQVHPREVFSDPILERAAALIVCHNHPSGNLRPSDEDIKVTRDLIAAGKILGIKLLDHIIFSKNEFVSLQERGFF